MPTQWEIQRGSSFRHQSVLFLTAGDLNNTFHGHHIPNHRSTAQSSPKKEINSNVSFKGISRKVLGNSQDLWERWRKGLGNGQESRSCLRRSLIRMLPPLQTRVHYFHCRVDSTPAPLPRLDSGCHHHRCQWLSTIHIAVSSPCHLHSPQNKGRECLIGQTLVTYPGPQVGLPH